MSPGIFWYLGYRDTPLFPRLMLSMVQNGLKWFKAPTYRDFTDNWYIKSYVTQVIKDLLCDIHAIWNLLYEIIFTIYTELRGHSSIMWYNAAPLQTRLPCTLLYNTWKDILQECLTIYMFIVYHMMSKVLMGIKKCKNATALQYSTFFRLGFIFCPYLHHKFWNILQVIWGPPPHPAQYIMI